ncbi:hypothetical protein L6452_32397 [Arctium lappa]|uniref:Uncharacterized protein n=1 Tax=Arctium lappa TaxID=4217 RepID=A0ACB8Z5L2_ARCLA|nr:hypothetical protein L6452_32397 [Arctium lappa]
MQVHHPWNHPSSHPPLVLSPSSKLSSQCRTQSPPSYSSWRSCFHFHDFFKPTLQTCFSQCQIGSEDSKLSSSLRSQSWYLFSTDIIVTISKYKKEVAETVIEKAKNLCKHLQNVKVDVNVDAKVEQGIQGM